MNADAIYLATYSALLLNYKLIQLGYYNPEKKMSVKIPLTEDEFVDEVHGSGVLVYLSATWLSELYQNVLAISLLEEAGYNPNNGQQYALINLLTGKWLLNFKSWGSTPHWSRRLMEPLQPCIRSPLGHPSASAPRP